MIAVREGKYVDLPDPPATQRHHCSVCNRWKRRSEFPRNPATLEVSEECLTCRYERERARKRELYDGRHQEPQRLPMEPMQQLIQRRGGPTAAALRIGVTPESVRQACRRESIQLGTADHWATELGEPLALLYPDLY